MVPAAIAIGVVLEIVAWRLVATGRASVWRLMVVVFALQGLLAVAAGQVRGGLVRYDAGESVVSIGLGAWTGAGLYLATRGFVAVASSWPAFRRSVEARYVDAGEVSLAMALILSVAVSATGEELFWRGLVQRSLLDLTPAVATLVSWIGFVGVKLASTSPPFIAGAIVGGALWAGLAWYTGGILASLVSHAIWTALMLAFPPRAGRVMMPA